MISSVSSSGSSLQSYWSQQLQKTQMQKQIFGKLDTNGDGSLSTDELDQLATNGPSGGPSAADFLKQMDTNSDGSVSESEFKSSAPPPPPPSQGGMSGTSSADFVQQLLNQIDTDGDGSVSESELSNILDQDTTSTSTTTTASSTESATTSSADFIKQLFDTMDTDSDGSISSDELSKYVANNPPMPPPPPSGGFGATEQAEQTSSTQATDTQSNMLEELLTALKENQTTNSSTGTDGSQTNTISSMLSSVLQSYMQLASNSFSQVNTESLLGSALYV
jgi:Ca2+-binding EF-hand superfamily protein